jgi:hypothetical protein
MEFGIMRWIIVPTLSSLNVNVIAKNLLVLGLVHPCSFPNMINL